MRVNPTIEREKRSKVDFEFFVSQLPHLCQVGRGTGVIELLIPHPQDQ